MPTPRVTIRLQVARDLMHRIQDISHHLDVLPADFIQQAIAAELARCEALRQKDQATLQALQYTMLTLGQSVRIETDAEDDRHTVCQVCLREIPRRRSVDGPLLCEACYALTQASSDTEPHRTP